MEAGYFQPWVPPLGRYALEDSLRLYGAGLISTADLGMVSQIQGSKGVLSSLASPDTMQLCLDVIRVVPGGAIAVLIIEGAEFLWTAIKEYVPAIAECVEGLIEFVGDAVEWTWENLRLTIEGLIYTIADWIDGWFSGLEESAAEAQQHAAQALGSAQEVVSGWGSYVDPSGYWSQEEYDAAVAEREEAQAEANEQWARQQESAEQAETYSEDEFGDPYQDEDDAEWEDETWDDPLSYLTDDELEDLENLYTGDWWDEAFMDPGDAAGAEDLW